MNTYTYIYIYIYLPTADVCSEDSGPRARVARGCKTCFHSDMGGVNVCEDKYRHNNDNNRVQIKIQIQLQINTNANSQSSKK